MTNTGELEGQGELEGELEGQELEELEGVGGSREGVGGSRELEGQVFNFSIFGNVTRYEYEAVYGLPLKITDANLKRKRFRSLILLFYFECA